MVNVILVVGPSASGKTTLVTSLLEAQTKPVVLLNDRTKGLSSFKPIEWNEAEKMTNCALLVEDLIAASDTEFKILQNVLSFSAHHQDVSPIVIIAHSIQHNNIQGLLPHVTEVFFTLSKSNVRSLGVVLSYFRFDKKEKELMEKKFLSAADVYGYFCLDVGKRTFEQMGGVAKITGGIKRKGPAISAGRFLKHAADVEKAQLLFDLIFPRLPEENKSEENFSLTLTSKKTGKLYTISVLDYIFALTDPDEVPSVELNSMHNYVMNLVHVPKRLIMNKKFKVCFL
jgi:energy-coupling factor transporter ATP-binding protein EcfA2